MINGDLTILLTILTGLAVLSGVAILHGYYQFFLPFIVCLGIGVYEIHKAVKH